jgi:transposase
MGKQRAIHERDNYINQTINSLPWDETAVLGVEDLTGIKRGKKKNRGKNFRKAMAPWVVRKAHDRLEAVAQENRVLLVKNEPANTSRTCPRCGLVSIENRTGESFECVACHYSGDSGHIAALNVLEKTIRKLSGRISSARVACDSAPILRKPEPNSSNQEVCVKLQSNTVATLSAEPC